MYYIDFYSDFHHDAYHFGESIGECITLNCSKATISSNKVIWSKAKTVELDFVKDDSAQSDFFIDLY